jgi:hypothetical protein
VFDEEKVPQEAPLQVGPEAVQFRLAPSPEVAVRERVCATVRPARFGVMETVDVLGLMLIARETLWAVSAGELESVTWNVRPVAFCAVVGVPVIEPDVERERPCGSVPPVSAHL